MPPIAITAAPMRKPTATGPRSPDSISWPNSSGPVMPPTAGDTSISDGWFRLENWGVMGVTDPVVFVGTVEFDPFSDDFFNAPFNT